MNFDFSIMEYMKDMQKLHSIPLDHSDHINNSLVITLYHIQILFIRIYEN